MSDGITDSYRDQERDRCIDEFRQRVTAYITSPTPDNYCAMGLAAKACDDVTGGYFTGRTKLVCECGFRSDPYDKAAVDAHLENFHPYRPLKENDGAPTK